MPFSLPPEDSNPRVRRNFTAPSRGAKRGVQAKRLTAFLCVVGWSIVGGTVGANDNVGWPHSRGPNYSGTSDESQLANSWPTEGPLVLWTRDIGIGYSGFAAMGNRVFTLTQTAYAQYVVCLDADTGSELWRYRYDWPYDGAGMYPGPRATPTLTQDHVFFAGPRGQIGCLRMDDGSHVWTVNVIETFQGKGFDFGYAASPLVTDGKVIVPAGGKGASVVALEETTGDLIWRSGDAPASYVGAIPITVEGHTHVVVFLQSSLASFDLQSGRLLWKHTFSQGYDEHAVAPIYREPRLLIASPFKAGAQMYAITSVPSKPGAESSSGFEAAWLWDNVELSNDTASSVLVGDYLFGFDLRDLQSKRRRPSRGVFRCIDWSTGEVLWSSPEPGHSTAIAADGKLFLFNDRGELILADASPDGYTELGRGQVFEGEICWTSPALHQGRLYLRSPSRCACVFVGLPSTLAKQQQNDAVPLSLIPKAAPVDLAWLVSGERRYPFDTHSMDELQRWFWAAMSALAAAAAVGALGLVATRSFRPAHRSFVSWTLFWMTTLVLGVSLTPILNRFSPEFYFTWPLALYATFQITILTVVWARDRANSLRYSWLYSRAALLAFVLICLTYFLLCRRLSHSMEWLFLVGFLPSSIVAIPAAYSTYYQLGWVRHIAWFAAAFATYFWASASANLWIE